MIRLLSDQSPVCGTEQLSQTRITIIKSLSKLLDLEQFTQMSFNECMSFLMNDTKGCVNPHLVKCELILIFEDRGFDVRFV